MLPKHFNFLFGIVQMYITAYKFLKKSGKNKK